YVLDLPYPLANDKDGSKEFSTLEYDLFENVTQSNCFKIDKTSSLIQLIRPLSTCTSSKNFKLIIRAEDNVNKDIKERNSANTTITIEITADATTQIPKQSLNLSIEVFQNIPSEISVFEDEIVGSVLLVLCKDDLIKNILQTNSSFNSTLTSVELFVRNSDLIELFKESEIRLSKSLKGYINQKLCAQIEANVIINSMEPQIISKNLCLKIEARPKSPIIHFPAQNSVHKFKENTPYDSLLLFNVTSPILDPKLNGLKYGLIETHYDDGQQFSIDSRGVLKAAHPFDYEKRDKYNIQTQICDFNDSCTVVAFRIQVEDLNDHCPTFMQRIEIFNITENHPVGQDGIEIGNFTAAEDADGTAEKRSICYRLENENDALFFIPDNRKPALFIRKSLDREEQDIHNVTIIAQDCHFKERDLTCNEQQQQINNKTEESNKKLLIINVLDVNDNFPQFSQKEYYGKVIERKTKFGAKILQVEARDPDLESKGLHYSMSSAVRTESDVIPREEAPFHIDSTTGDIISHVVYSSKMPHSYNFRVIVRDEADHEDEASVTISVINYNEQLELIFDFPEEITRQNQREISKLMFDVTSMYFVIDDINGHGNSTNLLAHFLEKDKLLASASKALTIFEETKSEQAQRARHELRRTHGLKKIFSDSANPDIMNGLFSGAFVDVYTLVIGAVCASLFVVIILPTIYLCCRRQNKASAKLNGNNPNHDVIYSNGIIADSLPSSSNNVALSKNSELLVNGLTLPSQRTSTLNTQQRPAPQMNSHQQQQQTPSRNESMITKSPEVHIFDALQSTEL
uniref:Cadherin domain-containing protein n=1 Tax=Panagrolaimus sp. PS1159 TaxID=55785 RepID=A0AC35GTP8_9BILA